MNKLFVSDLDGTLLDSNHLVSEKNIEALYLLKDKGYDLAFCSGRVLQSVKLIAKSIGLEGYYIGNNGAIISNEKQILFQNPIPKDKLRALVEIAERRNYGYHMYDEKTYFSNKFEEDRVSHLLVDKDNPERVKILCREDILEYLIDNDIPIFKLMYHMSFFDDLETYEEAKSLGGLYLAMSGHNSADIMKEGSNKGLAIDKLQEALGKEYDKIVAIGDHENDIPMLERSHIAIAMGNAIDQVKSKSDYVTDLNTNDGLYKAVKYVLEGE